MSATVWTIVGAAGLAQWIALAIHSARSTEPFPSYGLRASERNLLFSSGLALVIWFFAFDGLALLGPRRTIEHSTLAGSAVSQGGTCASVEVGMRAADVRQQIGKPDSVDSAQDLRGPGAEIWRYGSSRCTVYILDGRVEFIE